MSTSAGSVRLRRAAQVAAIALGVVTLGFGMAPGMVEPGVHLVLAR